MKHHLNKEIHCIRGWPSYCRSTLFRTTWRHTVYRPGTPQNRSQLINEAACWQPDISHLTMWYYFYCTQLSSFKPLELCCFSSFKCFVSQLLQIFVSAKFCLTLGNIMRYFHKMALKILFQGEIFQLKFRNMSLESLRKFAKKQKHLVHVIFK